MELLDVKTGLPALWNCIKKYTTDKISRIHTVTATGDSSYTNSEGTFVWGGGPVLIYDGTALYEDHDAGLGLTYINLSSGERTTTVYYVHRKASGDTTYLTEIENLVSALSEHADSPSYLCILTSSDALTIDESIIEALKPYGGGSDIKEVSNARRSFCFVGQAGMEEGTAWYDQSLTAGEKVTVSAVVANGSLLPSTRALTEAEIEAVCV